MSINIKANTNYSTLFGSLNDNSDNGFSLSDYSLIKSGAYKKLMTAYYSENASDEVKNVAGKTVAKDSTTQIQSLQDKSSKLLESATELYSPKNSSLYDEDQKEDLLKKVNSFVDGYNSMVKSADDSKNEKVLQAASNMVKNTSVNARLLSSVGISINSDNTLSINEETFKNAKSASVKSVFSGSGSFAYQTAASASNISTYVKDDAKKASGMYGSNGSYDALLNGSTYNSFM